MDLQRAKELLVVLADGISPSELAKIHKRSRGAITSRLSKLGEITK